jgi:predicted Zn-dependent protease
MYKKNRTMNSKYFLFAAAFAMMVSVQSCGSKGGKGLNLFSIQDELALGLQVKKEIESNPKDFPLLAEKGNEELYAYVRRLTNRILNTGKVQYRNEFAWEVKIINDPNTLNAFCAPGGYIYVYTGLIKFLDTEDQLMGVMGHEIAHAALRHSTRQLTKVYGLQVLASVVTGNAEPGLIEQIALGLTSLRFSRDHETEADTYSVTYLCGTDYNAAGAAGFFQKMEGQPTPPQFLSTHPNPGNRVQKIREEKQKQGCTGSKTNQSEYNRMKALIP